MAERKTGSCLCGLVRVEAVIDASSITACHCGQCRRWTGGGPYFSTGVSDVRIDGEDQIAIFAASEWGERGYCRSCGTTLFWRMKGKPLNNLAAGLFDDQSGLAVRQEIFVDRRPHWQSPWDGASQSTEAEEYAKLEAALKGSAT
ncbi:MAG: GFA family protein [Pseudomonadota bacterium]